MERGFSMKKILAGLCILVAASVMVFAQETEATEKSKFNWDLPVSVGAYGNFQGVVGPLAKYTGSNMGAGVSAEVGIPSVKFADFGVVASAAFNGNPVTSDILNSLWNMQFYGGVYVNIPIASSGFVFHPEVDYGIMCFFPTPSYSGSELKGCYVDQLLMANLGFRYSNEAVANGNIEFEIAPNIAITPEKGSAGLFIGGRIGVYYRINSLDK